MTMSHDAELPSLSRYELILAESAPAKAGKTYFDVHRERRRGRSRRAMKS